MYWIASCICMFGVSDADLHDIWPEIQLGHCEAIQTAVLLGGALVSDA